MVQGIAGAGVWVNVVRVPTDSGSTARYVGYEGLVLLLNRRD